METGMDPTQDQDTEKTEDQTAEGTEEKPEEKEETLGTVATLETIGPCKRRLKAEVPTEKVTEELDRNYKELISSVQIPGFRKGKVPRRLLERRYGEEIEGDVKEGLLARSFEEVAEEKDLKVVGKPKFDNVVFGKEEPLRYEVEFEVRPEFELGEYAGIGVEEVGEDQVPPVTQEAVDSSIEKLRQKRPQLNPVDPNEAGPKDFFLGHYVLRRDGIQVHLKEDVRFQPESGILDGFGIPDLAEKVASRGGSSAIRASVKVPDFYSEEVLRGKDAELEFTIEEARRVELPALDDEFAKTFGASSAADLRSHLEKELREARRTQIEKILEERIIEKISSGVQFDLPEGLLEGQMKLKRLRLELTLLEAGVPREEIDKSLQEIDEKKEKETEELRRELKNYFIVEKIAEKEVIFATEDEVDEQTARIARAHGRKAGEVSDEFEESGRIETLRAEIRYSKVLKFLREKANLLKAGGGAQAGPTGEAGEAPAVPEAGASPDSPAPAEDLDRPREAPEGPPS